MVALGSVALHSLTSVNKEKKFNSYFDLFYVLNERCLEKANSSKRNYMTLNSITSRNISYKVK